MTKPSNRAIAHLPPAVVAWFNAEQAWRDAIKAYNDRLAFVRAHCEFGTSVDPEYQLMRKAEKEARALIPPMFEAIASLAAAPEGAQGQHYGYVVDGMHFYHPDFPRSEWSKHKSVVPVYTTPPQPQDAARLKPETKP